MASKQSPPRTWAEVAVHSTVPKKSTFSALSGPLPPLMPSKSTRQYTCTPKMPSKASLEQLDDRNTCLIVAFSKSERCDFVTLFSALRRYGRIHYLIETTDNCATCVCYETKSAACNAQKSLTCIDTGSREYKVSLTWFKRREATKVTPTKNRSFLAQINTIREVHRSVTPNNLLNNRDLWLKAELGLESSESFMSALGPSFAMNDSEYAWVGRYPLRSRDQWFSPTGEAKPTLGDLLEASYRRTTLQAVKAHFQVSVGTGASSLYTSSNSPLRELPGGEIMSHSPSASPSSAASSSRSSSGYSTCVGSPASEKSNESITLELGIQTPFLTGGTFSQLDITST